MKDDSIRIFSYSAPEQPVSITPGADQYFTKRSFDVDVTTVEFKYRTSRLNLPTQLTTDFNGNVYPGYRLDRFTIHYRKTPGKITHSLKHKAITQVCLVASDQPM
jgi:hypothetical protein